MSARRARTRRRRMDTVSRLWITLGIPPDYAEVRGLPRHREARRLVAVGRHHRLAPRAARAWRSMQAAARADGVGLTLESGFRSVRRQAAIIRRQLAGGRSLAAILRKVAAPGCSEHHTGCALDLGDGTAPALTAAFGRTRAFRWLVRHAARFGFHLSYPPVNRHGFVYEPWHWRWRL